MSKVDFSVYFLRECCERVQIEYCPNQHVLREIYKAMQLYPSNY